MNTRMTKKRAKALFEVAARGYDELEIYADDLDTEWASAETRREVREMRETLRHARQGMNAILDRFDLWRD